MFVSDAPPNSTLWDNQANTTGINIASDTAGIFLSCVFKSLLIVSVIVGNILVIMCVFTYRPLRNVQNFYIVSLSCCDLAVAILVMPFHIVNVIFDKWVLGMLLCEIWLTSDILCCTASILNICVIALDRYRAIHDPINYAQKRTLRNVLLMIFLIWALSMVISVPPLFGWNSSGFLYNNVTMQCHLTDEKSYVIYSAFGSFFVPLLIMTFVYLKIFLATRARLRKRAMAAAKISTAMPKVTTDNGVTTESARVSTYSEEVSEVIPDSTDSDRKKSNENISKLAAASIAIPNSVSYSRNTPESVDMVVKPALSQPDQTLSNASNRKKRKSEKAAEKLDARRKREHLKERDSLRKRTAKNEVCVIKNPVVTKFLEERQRISLSKERKAARTLGVIMGTFVLCWLPFFLMYVILAFCENCYRPSSALEDFVVWLGYVNSTLNPIIYTCFNDEFRKAMTRLVCTCFRKKSQRRW